MTDQTGSTPETPRRRLIVGAPVNPTPRFLTPQLQAQEAQQQLNQPLSDGEQANNTPQAEININPEPVIPSQPVQEPAASQTEETMTQEMVAAEEQAGMASEFGAGDATVAAQEFAPAADAGTTFDPKIAEALNKIKEAQAELERAQQQALAMAAAAANPAPAQTPVQAQPTTQPSIQPVVPATPVLNTGVPSATPAPAPSPFQSPAPQAPSQASIPVTGTVGGMSAPAPGQNASTSPIGGIPGRPATGSMYGQTPPPKKSGNKIMLIVTGILVLLICGIAGYIYHDRTEHNKAVKKLEDYRKLGSDLNTRAKELAQAGKSNLSYQFKYSPEEYGISVTPDKNDAATLIAAIRDNKQRHLWESEMHVVVIMAALEPEIADMFLNDIRKNIARYDEVKLTQMATLLSSQDNPALLNKLTRLANDIGKAAPRKQSAIMDGAKHGMTPNDLRDLMAVLVNAETSDSMRQTTAANIEYLMQKANDSQREIVSREALSALKTADQKQKFGLLKILAQTGTPQALEHLSAMITNDHDQSTVALRYLSDWPNDTLIEAIDKMIASGNITNQKVIDSLKSMQLHQLSYNRDRNDETAQNMYQPFIDEAAQEKDAELQKQKKIRIINSFKLQSPRSYVSHILQMYKKDPNQEVSMAAEAMINRINEREEKKNQPVRTRAEQEAELLKMMGN